MRYLSGDPEKGRFIFVRHSEARRRRKGDRKTIEINENEEMTYIVKVLSGRKGTPAPMPPVKKT